MVDIAGRIPLERLASGNAALNDVMAWNGSRWVATAPGGGGAVVLGAAGVQFGWSSSIPTDYSSTPATTSATYFTTGTHGVSATGGAVTYCTDNVNSLYLVYATLELQASTPTDVFQVELDEWFLAGKSAVTISPSAVGGGANPGKPVISGGYTQSTSGGQTLSVLATSTGGTALSMTGTVEMLILRLAA